MKRKAINYLHNHRDTFLMVSAIFFELLIYLVYPFSGNIFIYLLLLFYFLYAIGFFLLVSDKNSWKKNLFYIIFAVGVILRTIYILKTSIYEREHDVLGMFQNGHLGYIYKIFTTHKLPMSNDWQFYHPPLWHFIGALWLHINALFKVPLNYTFEGIQIITLLLSSFIMIIVDRICSKIKINDTMRSIINLFFAVHPFLIIISGQINNDILLIFLQFLIILLLFNYYENKSIKNIIYLALATGFAVMTKMNGALMAVPILFIFIKEFIGIIKKDKSKIIYFFKKMFIFGFISLPIGLWFQIRNIILFKSNNVPDPGNWLYVGDYSFFKRFLFIDIGELLNFANMDTDYNLPAFIIKSSVFGEFNFNNIGFLAVTMITVNVILIIISILMIILYFKKKKFNIYMNTLFIIWMVNMISMIIFNINYPFACSMDFRYIGICLLPGLVFLYYMLDKIKNSLLKTFVYLYSSIFIICSIIFIIII